MLLDGMLARRIESAEASNAAGCGESLAVAGGFASFAGVGSPLTHAIGLGLNGPVPAAEFDAMEDFYRSRGSSVNLDFCPHADFSLMDLLGARGYRIVECSNVMAGPVVAAGMNHRIRRAEIVEEALWSRVMLEGFFGRKDLTAPELDAGNRLFRLECATAWFAMVEGEPAAAAAMNTRANLALLFADSTFEQFRGRGLHIALIRARLHQAAILGCDLATASVTPGSVSQRNYERAGFRVAYTKLNMQRDWL